MRGLAQHTAPRPSPAMTNWFNARVFSVPEVFDPAVMFEDIDGSDAEFRSWLESELGRGVSVPACQKQGTGAAADVGPVTAQQHVAARQEYVAWPQYAASAQQQQLYSVANAQAMWPATTAQQQQPLPAAVEVNMSCSLQHMQHQMPIQPDIVQLQHQQQLHQARMPEYCQQQQQLQLQQQQLQQEMGALHRWMQPFAQQRSPLLQDNNLIMPASISAATAGLPPAGQNWSFSSQQQQQQPNTGYFVQPAPVLLPASTLTCFANGLVPLDPGASSVPAQPASLCFGGSTFMLHPMQQQQEGLVQFGNGMWQQHLAAAGSHSLADASLGSFQQQQLQQGARGSVTSVTTDGDAAMCESAGALAPILVPVQDVRRVKRNNSTVTTATAAAAAAPARGVTGCVKKAKGPSTRFRERQRATISSLEAEVCSKLSELKLLNSENEKLKLRAAVLEATVNGREYHLKVLREHVQHTTPKSVAGSVGTPRTAASAEHSTLSTGAHSSCSDGGDKNSYSEVHNGTDTATMGSGCDVDGEMRIDNDASPRTPPAAAAAAGEDMKEGLCATLHTTGVAAAATAGETVIHATPAAVDAVICSGAVIKTEPDGEGCLTDSPPLAATAAKVAAPDAACPAAACCDTAGCCMCQDAAGPHGGAEELPPFCCMRHISTESIIQHWKQFLQAVSQELLQLELEEAGQKLAAGMSAAPAPAPTGLRTATGRKNAAAARANLAELEDHSMSDALAAVAAASNVCKWCGGGSKKVGSSAYGDVAMCGSALAAAAPSIAAAAAAAGPAAAAVTADVAGADGCTPSSRRIIALVGRYSYMTKYVAMLNPGMLYSLFGRNLDSGLPLPYEDDHWRHVVQHLGLRPQQVTAISECAELYFNSLGKLLQARRVLQQQLQQAIKAGLTQLNGCEAAAAAPATGDLLQPVPVAEQQLDDGSGAAATDAGNLHVLQLLDLLSGNLQREHVLRSMLKCFVWGRILDSIQFAKAAVYSHPLFPDVHALVCMLHESTQKSKQEQQHQQRDGIYKSVGLEPTAGGNLLLQQQQC